MEFRVLQYFLAVAREESVSGAAAFLHLSQPTLSRQLKDLEDELGKRLFIRGSDGSFTYGVAVAEDTGSAIKGNKIDLYFNTYRECIQFGRQDVTVYVLK